MPETAPLSEAALALLRDYRGDVATTAENRDTCRELAREGFLVARHSFTEGREASYRITELGMKLRGVLGRISGPSPAESGAPRR